MQFVGQSFHLLDPDGVEDGVVGDSLALLDGYIPCLIAAGW
jgi:hypothetical protein